jgi:Tol biopolymer transport system component
MEIYVPSKKYFAGTGGKAGECLSAARTQIIVPASIYQRTMITNKETPRLYQRITREAQAALTQMLLLATWAFLLASIIWSGCNIDVQEQSSIAPQHTSRQLTRDGWPKGDVAWSPDGTQIAYSWVQTTSVLISAPVDGSESNTEEMGWVNDNIDPQNYAVAPDGRRVVYVSRRKGSLWLVDLHNRSESLLTPDDRNARQPAWSPGGSRIAYSTPTPDSERSEIWVVEAAANAKPVLVSPSGENRSFSNPSWSPDETAIVCESDSNRLCIIELATKNLYVLVSDSTDSTYFSGPAWSPISDTIAYSVFRNGIQSIEILPAGGGEPRTVTPQFRSARNPAWSPDGSQLAFNSRSVVWVIAIDGTKLQQTDLSELKPIWWPSGNSLVRIEQTNTARINVTSLDGTPVPFLTLAEGGRDVAPAWYPEGGEFVFVRHDDNADSAQIRHLALGSGVESVLLDQSVFPDRFVCSGCISNPAISPVDASIIFDDSRDIFLLLPGGQPPLNLSADIAPRLRHPAWSPDGKQIVCVSDGRLIILEFLANTLVERRSITGSFANPAWSGPHPVFGSNIAVESGGGIFLVKPDRVAPVLILAGRHPAWSPDGTQLSFVQENEVHIVDVFVEGH